MSAQGGLRSPSGWPLSPVVKRGACDETGDMMLLTSATLSSSLRPADDHNALSLSSSLRPAEDHNALSSLRPADDHNALSVTLSSSLSTAHMHLTAGQTSGGQIGGGQTSGQAVRMSRDSLLATDSRGQTCGQASGPFTATAAGLDDSDVCLFATRGQTSGQTGGEAGGGADDSDVCLFATMVPVPVPSKSPPLSLAPRLQQSRSESAAADRLGGPPTLVAVQPSFPPTAAGPPPLRAGPGHAAAPVRHSEEDSDEDSDGRATRSGMRTGHSQEDRDEDSDGPAPPVQSVSPPRAGASKGPAGGRPVGAGAAGGAESSDLDLSLIYDPRVGLYFHPATNTYFARDAGALSESNP